ncbi:hypothetical protein DFH06DRAFT_1228773 [Mycena polygramma]|nr:hypothetical protein DFH06DRAFT_1228773 [Mycena polygramma]
MSYVNSALACSCTFTTNISAYGYLFGVIPAEEELEDNDRGLWVFEGTYASAADFVENADWNKMHKMEWHYFKDPTGDEEWEEDFDDSDSDCPDEKVDVPIASGMYVAGPLAGVQLRCVGCVVCDQPRLGTRPEFRICVDVMSYFSPKRLTKTFKPQLPVRTARRRPLV